MPETDILLNAAQAETLRGDMRDRILNTVRPVIDWSKLTEGQQKRINDAVDAASTDAIREIGLITAGRRYRTIPISVSGLKKTKDGDIESKLIAPGTSDNVEEIFHASRCLLVFADLAAFMGERSAALVMKDQPDLMDEPPAAQTQEDLEAGQVADNVERLQEGIKPLDVGETGVAEAPLSRAELADRAGVKPDTHPHLFKATFDDQGFATGFVLKEPEEMAAHDRAQLRELMQAAVETPAPTEAAETEAKPKRGRKKAPAPAVEHA